MSITNDLVMPRLRDGAFKKPIDVPTAGFAAVPLSARSWSATEKTSPGLAQALASAAEAPGGREAAVVQDAISEFGAWLRAERERRRLTQKDLAEQARTTEAQISIIERGQGVRGPSLETIARLLFALDLQLSFPSAEGRER